MKEPVTILSEALLSEKATMLSANLNKYVFSVHPAANRRQIKDAVESSLALLPLRLIH